MKYAVISSGSKQHLVAEGDNIFVDKIEAKKEGPVEFDKVLLYVNENKVEIGQPYLKNKIKGVVEDQLKDKKIRVFKYKAKTGYHKTRGHRQLLTKVKIGKL